MQRTKKIRATGHDRDNISSQVKNADKEMITNLYQHLGKADLIRIDGRMNASGFYLIELTADVGISTESIMTQAYTSVGYTYEQMLEQIINNAIQSWEDQNANMR